MRQDIYWSLLVISWKRNEIESCLPVFSVLSIGDHSIANGLHPCMYEVFTSGEAGLVAVSETLLFCMVLSAKARHSVTLSKQPYQRHIIEPLSESLTTS